MPSRISNHTRRMKPGGEKQSKGLSRMTFDFQSQLAPPEKVTGSANWGIMLKVRDSNNYLSRQTHGQ